MENSTVPARKPSLASGFHGWPATGFLALSLLLPGCGAVQAAEPPPASSHPHRFWQALSHTRYIAEGHKGPVAYLFMDPDCPYCHQLFDLLQKPVAEGRVRLRAVVVGFLTPRSPGKAAAILGAAHPLKALQYNEAHFRFQHGRPDGGIAPASPAAVQKLRGTLARNYAFLSGKESLLPQLGLGPGVTSVPLLVYRKEDRAHYVVGLPDRAQWKAITRAS